MTPSQRLTCARCVMLLGALLALLVYLATSPGRASRPGGPDEVLTLADQNEELDRQREAAMHRSRARRKVVEGVIAGRMDLAQAAACFRAMNESMPPSFQEAARCYYSAKSDEELAWRQVISWVRVSIDDEPTRAAVCDRLQQQLEEHLSRRAPRPIRREDSR